MQIKVGDYVKGQLPSNWAWEGIVVEVRSEGSYPIVKFKLNPHIYAVTDPISTTVELSVKYISEVNGQRYNWYKDWLQGE